MGLRAEGLDGSLGLGLCALVSRIRVCAVLFESFHGERHIFRPHIRGH